MYVKLKSLVVLVWAFSATFQVRSQGYLIPGGVTDEGFIMGLGHPIRVIQNPANGDFTDFVLQSGGGNTFSYSSALDAGVRVFLVQPGDPVSLQPILSQSYTELLYPTTYVFNAGIPFYVGLYAGNSYPVNGIYDDPLFGWAALVNNNGVIELLGSALEYGGGGIIAGTQTILPVPEPGALSLAALGTFLLGFRRWRASARLTSF